MTLLFGQKMCLLLVTIIQSLLAYQMAEQGTSPQAECKQTMVSIHFLKHSLKRASIDKF